MRLTTTQCRGLFAASPIARLATVGASGKPHLVPVTFAVIEAGTPGAPAEVTDAVVELVVFAIDHKPKSTTALRRLDNIAANPRVAFLADYYDDDWSKLWWVRVDARAGILDGADRARAIAALRAKYQQYERVAPHGVVVGAAVSNWSGWRFAGDED